MRRRQFIKLIMGLPAIFSGVANRKGVADSRLRISKTIPVSGELIPVIGMGSWITFDIGLYDQDGIDIRTEVLRNFFKHGGALIDSSPMYGNSEAVIGHCLKQLAKKPELFAATKVWTWGKWLGIAQMKHSLEYWGVDRFALMQIHNMLDWETHLETLRQWKQEGKIRYIGITTSHGRRHEELQHVLKQEAFDFVQFTYNMVDREAERVLLPLAAERGLAVIINRPFQRGDLFKRVAGHSLPPWASEIECNNWAQFFLKYIVSHPQVTCAIPATSRVEHMQENMGACYGVLPDATTRQKMLGYFNSLPG